MKTQLFRPFLFLAATILAVGLACNTGTTSVPPTVPPAVVVQPTDLPTLVPEQPTNAPALQSGDLIYSTTFSDLNDWSMISQNASSTYTVESRADGLFISVPEKNDYVTLHRSLNSDSPDVRLEADVELTGGTNYTYFILICRSSDRGEYDFILDTGGLWQIGKYDFDNSKYTRLKDGGSTKINIAKAKNHMTAICQNDTLVFKINGATMGTVTDSTLTGTEIGVEMDTFDYPHAEGYIHKFEAYLP